MIRLIDSLSLGNAGVLPITKLGMEDEGTRRIDKIPVTYKLEFCNKIYLYNKCIQQPFQLVVFI